MTNNYSVYEISRINGNLKEELVLLNLSEGEFKQFLVETIRNLDNITDKEINDFEYKVYDTNYIESLLDGKIHNIGLYYYRFIRKGLKLILNEKK